MVVQVCVKAIQYLALVVRCKAQVGA